MSSRIKEDVSKLFEFWCEIAPSENPDKVSGHIIESFPECFKDTQILTDITHFAFPCEFEKKNVEVYSFVLTDNESKWRFGFCRHDPYYPNAMVVLSYLPWHDTFIKFMNQLAEIKKKSYEEFRQFISDAYNKGVPDPGSSIKVPFYRGTMSFIFSNPMHFQLPNVLTSHNLRIYYSVAEPKLMIAIFAAMLAERRIIFKSNSLNKLSACIQAAHGFLYPMMWQHIFIPVLPMKMKDYLSAPMPYLIGVPENVLNTIDQNIIGEVVLFDCDKKQLWTPFEDVKCMPTDLINQLKKQLNNTEEHREDKFSKIFLGILVQLIGGYRDALKYSQGEKITWDRDAFIETRPQHLKAYLRTILDLQIFQQFIEERLDMLNTGDGISDEFEIETVRWAEKMGKRKPYKQFFRNVKDKTNPAMKSAVKSVKEGGKGVKSAYKDLTSKFRDNTPTKNYNHHSNDFNGQHFSAPSSPLFSRRIQSEISYFPSANNKPNVQLSSSLLNNSTFYNSNNSSNNNLNNLKFNKSPPMSPPHSNSSSEMNILQELQQYDLFKSPAVDRSLKPSNTREQHRNWPAPERAKDFLTGLEKRDHVMRTNNQNFKNLSPTNEKSFDASSSLCMLDTSQILLDQTTNSTTSKTLLINSSSLFDTSPVIQSPPVPPPRINVARNRSNDSSLLLLSSSSPPPPPPQPPSSNTTTNTSSSAMRFENNFVNSDLFDLTSNMSVSVPSISRTSTNHNNNNNNTQSLVNTNTKTTSFCEPMKNDSDLIKLDSNNTSFEIEDFDPLNKNAKPLPTITPVGFNNPLYPYYQPKTSSFHNNENNSINLIANTEQITHPEIDLLREYGLDKLTVGNNDDIHKKNIKLTNGIHRKDEQTSSSNNSSDKCEWIQFD